MTTIEFNFRALPQRDDGTHVVHMYVKQREPDWEDTPRNERLAIEDAAKIVHDIVRGNDKDSLDPTSLLREGEPPDDSIPIIQFAIGISWDRGYRMAHYSRVGYLRTAWDAKWNPVASTAMELFDYTMSVLRSREKAEKKSKTKKGK